MEELYQQLTDIYGMPVGLKIQPDRRGMMNKTYYVGNDSVLTIFNNRSLTQVALIAEIVQNDQSTLLPPIINANGGPVAILNGQPAILWARLGGVHYVEQDHSNKIPIPEKGHASIASSFWKLHKYLGQYQHVGGHLGRVNYLPSFESGEPEIEFTELPMFLQTGLVVEYLQADQLPLKYPALVHHDMERQNFLHGANGTVVGIVDADSFKQGDVLFEYCRCMMNFMFSDPKYTTAYADLYMSALINSGIVDAKDIEHIPTLIRAFVAKDLLDYCRYESTPPKTNLSRLADIYDKCLNHVDNYFTGLSLPALMRGNGIDDHRTLPKIEGPQ